MIKYLYIFISCILLLNTFNLQSDDELKGIPQSFDPEYKRMSDYPYFTLDSILSTFYDKSKFNQNVCAIGYISRDSSFNLKSGELLLQRIFVTCCISHAQPVSVHLLTELTESLPDSTWVKVNGKVIGLESSNVIYPAIKAERIEIITQPINQYLNCNACPTDHR